ncbi:MAG: HlyD family efflux transporter periplasmic adaptor subunit [Pontiellaceae bacterium]|nr:HlyD family efflux transporter periplasmic adaptor subunit [Pontiellaceae bacterium]
MDIPKHISKGAKARRWIGAGAVFLVLGIIVYFGVVRLEPAAPTAERASLMLGKVERGDMLVAVRGVGRLVSKEMLIIPSEVSGRVIRIPVEPGEAVEPDTVIYELSNPELHLRYLDAQSALNSARLNMTAEKAELYDRLLGMNASLEQSKASFKNAQLRHEVQKQQFEDGLISELQFTVAANDVENQEKMLAIQQERFETFRDEIRPALLANIEASVKKAESEYALRERQDNALKVRAGTAGVLAPVQTRVELGEQVSAGQILARITNPQKLKAQLRIPQGQARDVVIGLRAEIDTYDGVIIGRVFRIEPSVVEGDVLVDVELDGKLPKVARPDLSVVGSIQIMQLKDVLYVNRPMMVSGQSRTELFKMEPSGETAVRVPVQFGRASANEIEVIEGLEVGDEIILSDLSEFGDVERLRVK